MPAVSLGPAGTRHGIFLHRKCRCLISSSQFISAHGHLRRFICQRLNTIWPPRPWGLPLQQSRPGMVPKQIGIRMAAHRQVIVLVAPL
jgi:hypothetical protein